MFPQETKVIEVLSSSGTPTTHLHVINKPPTTPPNTARRNEFVEVLTTPYLLPSSSSSTVADTAFPSIMTERTLLLSRHPRASESFLSSNTSVILSENPADLLHIYDDIFPDLQQ